jgi:hypothetical protein
MERFNFDLIQGSAPILRFRLTVPENITDWDTVLYINDKRSHANVFTANGAVADSTEVPDAQTVGVFDVPLSKQDTLSMEPQSYDYAFWRVNPGFEDPLASGTVRVKELGSS